MSSAIVTVAVLMLGGVALRQAIPALRALFIPASVVAGFIGLAVAGSLAQFDERPPGVWMNQVCGILSSWPGPLIAIVFASMMLQQPSSSPRPRDESSSQRVIRQGVMVWIIVLGETLVGLLATWLLIKPFYQVPNSFGMLIETGFAGGHGTAAAMGQVFSSPQVNLPTGLDLGLLMATCGLVYGLVSGIFWINLARKLGWLKSSPVASADDRHDAADSQSQDSHSQRKPIGFQTLSADVIDPLLLQVIWVALAFGAGLLMQTAVMSMAGSIDNWIGAGGAAGAEGAEAELSKRLTATNVLDFPLFIYTMFGGWMLRRGLQLCGRSDWIDSSTIQRISATAMEILVVAAITSLKLSAVAALLGPFLILFGCGAVWTAICLLVISKHVLPRRHWFPLALINYGMSTGTTATGFVLLRVVDPELKTDAASDYALAAPLSAPFIGGGILTIALPLIVLENVSIAWPVAVIAAMVAALIFSGRRMAVTSDAKGRVAS